MQKFLFFFFVVTISISAQTNEEIAGIYLVKSEAELKNNDITKAVTYFDKASALLGDTRTLKVEELGIFLYYQLKDYQVSKEHAKRYFALAKDKSSEKYQEVLFLYVEIEELIEEENNVKAAEKAEQLLKEKEINRLAVLKMEWQRKADALVFEADSIFSYDKNGMAPFASVDGKYGVVDDQGNVIITASYSSVLNYDGYIVLLEGIENQPTKIEVFNTATKSRAIMPAVSFFNSLSTHYGKVMLPRANGVLVAYPNNSNKVAVYDLATNSLRGNSNLENHFKYWKDLKVIKKYNKNNQIKIDKQYLNFGGDLLGFSAFYNENSSLFGFISVGGVVVPANAYSNIGTLNNGFAEAIKSNGTSVWLNEKGEETKALINKNGEYSGSSTLVKLASSKYQFRNEGNQIVKGNEVLDDLKTYLKKVK